MVNWLRIVGVNEKKITQKDHCNHKPMKFVMQMHIIYVRTGIALQCDRHIYSQWNTQITNIHSMDEFFPHLIKKSSF